MKVAFVHDHRFVPLDGSVYSSGSFPAYAWDRYLDAFQDVTVLCRQGTADTLSHREIASGDGVSFCFLPSLSSALNASLKRGGVTRMIRQALQKVDACIVRLPSELGYAALSVADQLAIPCAVEVAGCPWDGLRSHGSRIAGLYAPVARMRMRHAVSRAPFVLYVTNRFLQSRYPADVDAVTVGCSNVMIPAPSKQLLDVRLARLSRPRKVVKLGLIGSLKTRSKGIQTVLNALALMPQGSQPVTFHVLGSGDADIWIKLAEHYGVQTQVSFEGTRTAGQAVLDWLKDIDLYLQPSLKEGLPRALIEAMSQACPAIGSRCAGIPELLAEDDLVEPGNAAELALQISKRSTQIANTDVWAQNAAQRNWTVSKSFDGDLLARRRREFWSQFASYAHQTTKTERLA